MMFSSKLYRHGPALKVKFTSEKHEITSVELLPQNGMDFGLEWSLMGEGEFSNMKHKIEQWIECFCNKQQPDVILPVVLDHLPPYTRHVLAILQHVPFGSTVTYQELAKMTGSPRAARAVGSACGRNPCPLIIPCHRVLASHGIGGFSAGIDFKKILLGFES